MTKKELGKRFPNKVYFWNYLDTKVGWFYAPHEFEWNQSDDAEDCNYWCQEVYYENDVQSEPCRIWGRSCYTSPEAVLIGIYGWYIDETIRAEKELNQVRSELAKVDGMLRAIRNPKGAAI